MKKEEYWQALVTRNPAFGKTRVTITGESLKKIVFQAHDKGREAGKQDMPTRTENTDLFSQLFGGGK